MSPTRLTTTVLSLILLSGIAACGKKGLVQTSCDEPQRYQAVVPGKRVEVPEGLDPLDEFKEMPIPTSKVPAQPPGSKCIEYPPSAKTDS
jgi:uncharacterized lipoprotein